MAAEEEVEPEDVMHYVVNEPFDFVLEKVRTRRDCA